MRRVLLRSLLPAVALLVAALVIPGQTPASSSPSVAPAAYVAPSSSHPYSDPVWFPLRTTAQITCVYSNCSNPVYHGYWAMDLDGDLGDPIYAAGAGVFHVGAVDSGCRASVNDAGGTWVWIDHGAGKVSRYHHLDSVVAKEGQYVTPSTVIGRMGHSGDVAPCTTNYLHFEVRVGGVKGTRINPGTLLACVNGTRQSWPQQFGKTSWDYLTRGAVHTPASTTCATSAWTATPAAPAAFWGGRGSGLARVSWTAPPSGTNRVVVAMETYHPSVPEWGAPVYRTLSSTTRTSLYTGLQNGRQYRFKLSFHNSAGNSAWSRYVYLTPAGRPSAPRVARWLTATSTKIRYAWWKSAEHGTPVTSYTIASRSYSSAGWSRWHYVTVSKATYNYNWTRVTRGKLYQVTVRANSAVGPSAFATRKYVRVPR